MALPLKVHQRMIGVLDVQSTKSGAFTDEDIEILRTLANQLALAIDNARLFADSQSALEELQELYQQQVARAWRRRLEHQPLAYHYTRRGVHPIEPVPLPEEPDAWTLVAPIVLRGQSLGALVLRRSENQPVWSPDEVEMVRATVAQVALTLENVRLLEENRRRAMNEQMIGHITARTQSLLDLEAVMKTAVQEIGQALGDARVQIRLANGDGNSSRLSPGASPNG
jgi:GAF domain-containing protein